MEVFFWWTWSYAGHSGKALLHRWLGVLLVNSVQLLPLSRIASSRDPPHQTPFPLAFKTEVKGLALVAQNGKTPLGHPSFRALHGVSWGCWACCAAAKQYSTIPLFVEKTILSLLNCLDTLSQSIDCKHKSSFLDSQLYSIDLYIYHSSAILLFKEIFIKI